MRQLALYIWASPTSLIALSIGVVGLPWGTKIVRCQRTIEIHGGLISWLLERTPIDAAAMTLGHVIWGQNETALNFCREHELIHVRQYERWGPLFIPMYLFFSCSMWLRGRHAYYDNPFEKEAFGENHPHYRSSDPTKS